ncbi:IS110 family transposase [Kordiimonas sp.]|uniref:IS110 family transposase n=1 Tax=Kordiimonas sp. TaxID=1970157 RepID=UPI003A94052A
MTYVGVDLHKRDFTVCYRRGEDDQVTRKYENSASGLASFLKTVRCVDKVAVEAMGISRRFVKAVAPAVHEVVYVDAARNTLVSRSIKKTDANDAALLAFGLEKGVLPRARLRSEASQQVRSILAARELLVSMRVRVMNQLNVIAARNGFIFPPAKVRHKIWRDRVDLETFEFGDRAAWYALNNQMDDLRRDILSLEKEASQGIQAFHGYEEVSALPGFGPITVATILSYIDNIDDFPNSKSLVAYFGIAPRTRISAGEPIPNKKFGRFRSGAITRTGDSRARAALVMAVNRVLCENESLRAFYDRIKGRKGYRKARTAAARKLLCLVYYILKNGYRRLDFAAVKFNGPFERQLCFAQELPSA